MSKTATIKKGERILADFERLSKKRKKEVADFDMKFGVRSLILIISKNKA